MKTDKEEILKSAQSALEDARDIEALLSHRGWPLFCRLLKEQIASFIKASNRWKVNKCPKCESEGIVSGLDDALRGIVARGTKAAGVREKFER